MIEWIVSVVFWFLHTGYSVGSLYSLEEVMIRQLSSLSFLGLLTLVVSSCGTTTTSETPVTPSPTQPTPVAVTPSPSPTAPTAQKVQGTEVAADLVPSTNADTRAQEVLKTKGSRDPFSVFAVQPEVILPPALPAPPQLPRPTSPRPGRPIVTRPPLPPPPSTDLARGVEVTGVVQIGVVPQAIVKAPNEPTSRYVEVGQRLSNGQVLVKNIIVGPGSNPVIVLEQNGVEVVKTFMDRTAPRAG